MQEAIKPITAQEAAQEIKIILRRYESAMSNGAINCDHPSRLLLRIFLAGTMVSACDSCVGIDDFKKIISDQILNDYDIKVAEQVINLWGNRAIHLSIFESQAKLSDLLRQGQE